MIPMAVRDWLASQGYGSVERLFGVGGGCINNGARLQTSSGRTFFLKTNPDTPADMFAREAEGLEALKVPGGPRVPDPYLHGPDFLLMEDLSPAARRQDYWEFFGHQLAALHTHTSPRFGFEHDNYIGSTPQPNAWSENGVQFFAEHRLLFQARLAYRRGLLGRTELGYAERMAKRLPELVPAQAASLLHGDLWSGNAIPDQRGNPALIDPAAHYGWAEAELGMTTLFGSFPEAFYRAYQEVHPLFPDWQNRLEVYNTYHILNHLNLFGSSYYHQAVGGLKRFS